jgi:ATP-dependent RNA helicase DeaD
MTTNNTFESLNLSPEILEALRRMGFKEPTPVQAQTVPLIQDGHDIIALAETGSGKTAACAIPVCDRVDVSKKEIQALIIVPTRELALQYATETQKIGNVKKVSVVSVLGGEDQGLQLAKIKHGAQVCVATPGRLIDFIYSRAIDLSQVSTLILDEADEMLSMGFYDDLEFVINCLIHKHQTLLFSATMPSQIKKIASQHMQSPKEITLTGTQSSPKNLNHRFVYCRQEERVAHLGRLHREFKPNQSLIFCESRLDCEKVCRALRQDLQAVDYLHAGLPQEVRSAVTGKFRNGRIKTLVATDVAARGLDFSGVTHVFLFQLPRDPEVYVHRSGRTGRSGREGTAISLITPRDLGQLGRVLDLIKQKDATWLGDPPPPNQPRRNDRHPPRRPRSN